jgi:hypothetical protein
MKKINTSTAHLLATLNNISLKETPLNEIRDGLNIEMEHKDVINGDITTLVKIVKAHLKENPRYYLYLKAVEDIMDKLKAKK